MFFMHQRSISFQPSRLLQDRLWVFQLLEYQCWREVGSPAPAHPLQFMTGATPMVVGTPTSLMSIWRRSCNQNIGSEPCFWAIHLIYHRVVMVTSYLVHVNIFTDPERFFMTIILCFEPGVAVCNTDSVFHQGLVKTSGEADLGRWGCSNAGRLVRIIVVLVNSTIITPC